MVLTVAGTVTTDVLVPPAGLEGVVVAGTADAVVPMFVTEGGMLPSSSFVPGEQYTGSVVVVVVVAVAVIEHPETSNELVVVQTEDVGFTGEQDTKKSVTVEVVQELCDEVGVEVGWS